MSYDCDNCGKNSVEQYGSWCSECQQREAWAQEEADGRWFRESALCHKCNFAWGPDASDKCEAYDMPLYMVKRKRKCKLFEEYQIHDFRDYN